MFAIAICGARQVWDVKDPRPAARGAEVHVLGISRPSPAFARAVGVHGAWTESDLPRLPFAAVIDASTSPDVASCALDLVEPGRRVVYIGVAGSPSSIDTRTLVLRDVTAVGILGASACLAGTRLPLPRAGV